MADKTPEQEPSIEEILASIRQIISDDDDKDSVADSSEAEEESEDDVAFEAIAAMEKPAKAPVQEPEEDILELTEQIEDEPEEDIEVDLQEHEDQPDVPQEVEMEDDMSAEPVVPTPVKESEILTDAARSATISSMAKLAGNMPVTRNRANGDITLEDLVREMLNPMLKDWLSDNLPPMVERMVQKELEKLARKAQDV